MPLDRVFGQPFDDLVGHPVGGGGRSYFGRLPLLRALMTSEAVPVATRHPGG
jgi:hypothetical protein